MGSRRPPTRSVSWNGRITNGDNGGGISRSGGCSYISNVRPETRSTFCSVMAQLTEETQPAFETTLKSKAVSESSNVKFSCVVTGHPTPQITWYRDDMQLDRYCGLPKYEIFRNGQVHTLHIYDCTVDDAAIYQASAINSKGIVSCSGVLEVGEMNEFKIHQRYFAKLKQKAEQRRREVEGKENQEPLRTISPDRTQRKRRSTMEAFLNTPSSTEEESNEESHQALAVETEAQLQEITEEKPEDKPAANGQETNESVSKARAFINDTVQKIFTSHAPKAPFVKKKIKISNKDKADTLNEKTLEEKRAKIGNHVAPSRSDLAKPDGKRDEIMEMEKISRTQILNSGSKNVRKQTSLNGAAEMLVERLQKDEGTRVMSPKHLTVSPAAVTSEGLHGSEIKHGHAKRLDKAVGLEVEREPLEKTKQHSNNNLNTTQSRLKSNAASTRQNILKNGNINTENPAAMEIDEKTDNSSGRASDSTDYRSVAASSPRPCEQSGGQLSQKETYEGLCRPETKTGHIKRLDTEVGQKGKVEHLEKHKQHSNRNPDMTQLKSTQQSIFKNSIIGTDNATAMEIDEKMDNSSGRSLDSGDRRTVANSSPRGREQSGYQLSPKETKPSLRNVSETERVLPAEVTQVHTRMNNAPVKVQLPSNKSKMDVPPQQQEERPKSRTDDKQSASLHCGFPPANDKMARDKLDQSRESNESQTGSLTILQKSPCEDFDGGDNNLECGVSRPAVQSQFHATTESAEEIKVRVDEKVGGNQESELLKAPNKFIEMETEIVVLNVTEKTTGTVENDTNVNVEDFCNDKNEHLSKMAEESPSEMQSEKSNISNTSLSNIPEHAKTLEPTTAQSEIPEPEPKIISVAELLRSQIKALELDLESSLHTVLAQADFVQEPTPAATKAIQGSTTDDKCKLEVKTLLTNRKIETISDDTPAPNIKATRMEVYGQVNETNEESVQTESKTSSSVLDLQRTGLQKYNVCIGNGQRVVPDVDQPVVQLKESPVSSAVTIQESEVLVLKQVQNKLIPDKDEQDIQKLTPEIKLNGKSDRDSNEMNSTQLSDLNKMKEHLQIEPKYLPKSVFSSDAQEYKSHLIQPDSSMVEELPRSDSLTSLTPEASPSLKRRNCASTIPSATPQELASGARRKILTSKAKLDEAAEATSAADDQVSAQSDKLLTSPVTPSSSPSLSRRSPLLQPPGDRASPVEKRSPLLSRRRTTMETQATTQVSNEKIQSLPTEEKLQEKPKNDPFKAPQVIRKVRGESYAEASGHLKLWCQFFNILSDSTIKWYRNEEEIARIKKAAGDETQVNLAIVQASCRDTGVYGCSITNEYGTDSTDMLLSADILAGMSLREDLGVGEEIELTPMIFSKGVADSGGWANKLFGRILMQESHIGHGCSHKVWRAKVIYGLEPVFESGNTCIIKVRNPIAYGGKGENNLLETNLDIVKQDCRIQNLAREYCKIFSAEARGIENFGSTLDVLPVFLVYRPANTVPYATVEADLTGGDYLKYCDLDQSGRIHVRNSSMVEQKCCALQHWIFQWTSGNLLFSRLEGVDTKITNVGISVKSGHHCLSVEGNPKVFEHFVSQHQCNYFCGLLGLRSLKVMDSLLTPAKPKGSKSPLLQRKMAAGSSSPQMGRKAANSPRVPRKTEPEGGKTPAKEKSGDAVKAVNTIAQ